MTAVLYSARKRHPAFALIIRHIVNNIQRRRYFQNDPHGWGALQITGPGAYEQALEGYWDEINADRRLQFQHANRDGGDRSPATNRSIDGFFLLFSELSGSFDKNFRQAVIVVDHALHYSGRKNSKFPPYGDLYAGHQVYCDEPGQPCPSVDRPLTANDTTHFANDTQMTATNSSKLNVWFTAPTRPQVMVELNKRFVPEGTAFHYFDNGNDLESCVRAISHVLAAEGNVSFISIKFGLNV